MARYVDEIGTAGRIHFLQRSSAQLRLLISTTLRPLPKAHSDNLPRRHDVEENANGKHGRRIEHVQTV